MRQMMVKGTLAILMIGLISVLAQPVVALDKAKLEDHLRKSLNLDTRQEIKIGEPQKSELGNLKKVDVFIGRNTYEVFYPPKETHYLWGTLFDFRVDPDQERFDQIDLTNAISQGNPKAPVTIIEYTDLQCPYCKKAHEALKKELYTKYTKDQVRWVFKHFPLGMHPWAEPAAVATECAAQSDKGWEMSELFFDNTSTLTPQNVKEKSQYFAKKLGLDEKMFTHCLEDAQVAEKVQADKDEGVKVGVTSTPTLFVNGRMRRGFRDFGDVSVLIDEKLEAAKKK